VPCDALRGGIAPDALVPCIALPNAVLRDATVLGSMMLATLLPPDCLPQGLLPVGLLLGVEMLYSIIASVGTSAQAREEYRPR
jgi:hypothetical protein